MDLNLLSLAELVNKLNEGGWVVWGGREARKLGIRAGACLTIIKVSLIGILVRIDTPEHSFEMPTEFISIPDPGRVYFYCMAVEKRQRKKIDGGGWYEAPVVKEALELYSPSLSEAATMDHKNRISPIDPKLVDLYFAGVGEDKRRLQIKQLNRVRDQFKKKRRDDRDGN